MEPVSGVEEEPKLRHVEKDVLIPKMMREKAQELCSEKVQAFSKCCQDSGILMVIKCREENAALKECLTAHYTNPAFYEECKTEYLKQREEFRATGIRPSQKESRIPTNEKMCILQISDDKRMHLTQAIEGPFAESPF